MGQIVDVVYTKTGELILRYTIKRSEVEVCDESECRTVAKRVGVLSSITLPDGRRVRRDVDKREFEQLVSELNLPTTVPLKSTRVV